MACSTSAAAELQSSTLRVRVCRRSRAAFYSAASPPSSAQPCLVSRRLALPFLSGAAALTVRASPALAGGLERYVRRPKPVPPTEELVASALLSVDVLESLQKLLEETRSNKPDSVSADTVAELRSGLRFGPLGSLRDTLRTLARALGDDSLKPKVERVFLLLEDSDKGLVAVAAPAADDTAKTAALSTAATALAASVAAVRDVLSAVDSASVEKARALLT